MSDKPHVEYFGVILVIIVELGIIIGLLFRILERLP